MELMYTSTRNANEKVTASQAILKGLAEDGGLFVPEQLPTLDKTVDELAGMTYQETAYEVMKKFLTDFTEEELKNCINAYRRDRTIGSGGRSVLSGVVPWLNDCF